VRAWLVGAALIAVLLGAIGCGLPEDLPHGPGDGAYEPEAAAVPAAPLSVVRRGNEFTLTGDVPTPVAKRALVDAVITSADDATVIDGLAVTPGARTPDLSAAGSVFAAAAVIGDFTLRATGDTVTLGGTAVKAAEAAAVADAAEQAWPRADIVDELVIRAPGPR